MQLRKRVTGVLIAALLGLTGLGVEATAAHAATTPHSASAAVTHSHRMNRVRRRRRRRVRCRRRRTGRICRSRRR